MDMVSEQSFENALDKIRELSKQKADLLYALEAAYSVIADCVDTGDLCKEGTADVWMVYWQAQRGRILLYGGREMSEHRKVGDKEMVEYVWRWHGCQECETPARYKIGYLLDNARSNPSSSGYRKDDISWCSDDASFACEKHKRQVENDAPVGHGWASTFKLSRRFKHMGFYKVKEQHYETQQAHGSG